MTMVHEVARGCSAPPLPARGGGAGGVTAPSAPSIPAAIASPEAIRAWLQQARAGDEFVYATRAGFLPAGDAGAGTVRLLAHQGVVHALQRPIAGRQERDYVVRRTAKALPGARAPRSTLSPVLREVLDAEVAAIEAVYPILVKFAQFARPCPTDAQLASKAGIARDIVPATLDAMRAAGIIAVHAAPAPTLRQVTIVGTGARTGLSV